MSNLRDYQSITTAAKAAGGVEQLLTEIKDSAVADAAPRHRMQGVIVTLVVGGLLFGGQRIYATTSARRAAHRAAGAAAEEQVRSRIQGEDGRDQHSGGAAPPE